MADKISRTIIIGGISGIGLATARLFGYKGRAVTIAGRNSGKSVEALQLLGPTATGEELDASDRPALDAFFERIGAIDRLVLAASGSAGAGSFAEFDVSGLRQGFEAKFGYIGTPRSRRFPTWFSMDP